MSDESNLNCYYLIISLRAFTVDCKEKSETVVTNESSSSCSRVSDL